MLLLNSNNIMNIIIIIHQQQHQRAILHLTQVARNVYQGLMDSANEWTSAGDVISPPMSPSIEPKSRGGAALARLRDTYQPGRGHATRRKGSGFLKKLFKRDSTVPEGGESQATAAAPDEFEI